MGTLNFDVFFGLDGLINRLKADFSGDRYVHAYLFSGPKGTGKRTAAEICARAVHCLGETKPCDRCPPCSRMIAGVHPDHAVLSATGRSIGVDEVRLLIRRVSIKPFEGGRHTVIIDEAEKMTQQAQNALLKTLETPPGGAVFFLLTTTPSQLLATIVSRCRQERFHPVRTSEAERALIKLGAAPERAALAAAASGGSVGRALHQLEDATYWAARDRMIGSLSALKGREAVAEAASMLTADKEAAPQILEILESLARDMVRASGGLVGAQPGANVDISVDAQALLMGVMNARRKLNANVSWQTVLEMLYFESLRGTVSWQQ
jgi:DNA polymerase-3 subunit delta'